MEKTLPASITINNFRKFPPSEFIRSVRYDVERVLQAGYKMDMMDWFAVTSYNGQVCSCCLGGAAILGFCKQLPNGNYFIENGSSLKQVCNDLSFDIIDADLIAQLFNSIRMGVRYDIISYILKIWEPSGDRAPINQAFRNLKLQYFRGDLDENQTARLLKTVDKIANALEKAGF